MNPLERLLRAAQRPTRVALGLMSGMSRDGLDLALVRLSGGEGAPATRLLHFASWPYGDGLRDGLAGAGSMPPAALCDLERELTSFWVARIEETLASRPGGEERPYVIGSHGQTVYHRPRAEGRPAATLQIGDGDLIAERTGLPVVSDFRRRDVAAGGEGAPLIPVADWLLFGSAAETSACHNLGSIANVTVLPPDAGDLLAFDTGPANALIDAFARLEEGSGGIDRDGTLSAAGRVDDDLLLWLYVKRAAWLAAPPPKSAGYGTFGQALADEARAAHPDHPVADLVRTAVAFTARTLAEAYERHVLTRFPDLSRVRFSGGGCFNPTLMEAIRGRLEELGLEVEVLEPDWIAGKEAVGFALLADCTARGVAGNHPGATGASRPAVLGKISP